METQISYNFRQQLKKLCIFDFNLAKQAVASSIENPEFKKMALDTLGKIMIENTHIFEIIQGEIGD